ncbi:metallophosphoesterase family protein [Carnobacteriaceae bacterium 52-44]
MNKEKIFVVGDVHGQITMVEKLLKHWKPEEEQLLFVGDLADRGENSKATLELARDLVEKQNAIVIKGNHDEMLEMFLENPSEHVMLYYMNGGGSTVNSLLGREANQQEFEKNAQEIKEQYPWLLPFLKSLPLHYEWEDYLFVHAGVNLRKDNWRDSSNHDFVWIREGFYDQPNHTDKTIIFGHTVTATLNKGVNNFDVWESGDGLIGLDGGAVYGGKMHALVLTKDKIEDHYFVENEGYRF